MDKKQNADDGRKSPAPPKTEPEIGSRDRIEARKTARSERPVVKK